MIWIIAVSWPLPWPHYPLSVAIVAGLLSLARWLWSLKWPTRRLVEMVPHEAALAQRRALWGGIALLAPGLGLYWLCRRVLPPIPTGLSLPGSVLDFYVENDPIAVALAYVSVLALYFGFAMLVRVGDLATDG